MGPQCEDGFTRIANELMDALATIRIPGESMQILWTILRKTYGFGKKEDRISLAQFHESTDIPKPRIVRALSKLVEMQIVNKNGSGHFPNYGINKRYEEWEATPKKPHPHTGKVAENSNLNCRKQQSFLPKKAINIAENSNNPEEDSGKKLLKTATEIAENSNAIAENSNLNCRKQHPQKKKETITKETTKERLPICEAWKSYIAMRIKIKKPMTAKAMELAVMKIAALQSSGNDPVEVLNQSTFNSWQGLFPIKVTDRSGTTQTDRAQAIREANHQAAREFCNEIP